MGMGLVLIQIVAVIGGHKRDAKLPGKLFQAIVDNGLFRYPVFLHLKIKAVFKQGLEIFGLFFCAFYVVFGNKMRYFSMQTGSECNETIRMCLKYLLVNAGFIIKTF